MQRFDPGAQPLREPIHHCPDHDRQVEHSDHHRCQADKVEFDRQTHPSDPWADRVGRTDAYRAPIGCADLLPVDENANEIVPSNQPERISPVIGSPALAGLGVALIVPGTLLDVVA